MKRSSFSLLSLIVLLIISILVSTSLTSCQIKVPTDIDYASNHFDDYNLPEYNKARIRTAERIFRDYSVITLPYSKTLAESTISLYIEHVH